MEKIQNKFIIIGLKEEIPLTVTEKLKDNKLTQKEEVELD